MILGSSLRVQPACHCTATPHPPTALQPRHDAAPSSSTLQLGAVLAWPIASCTLHHSSCPRHSTAHTAPHHIALKYHPNLLPPGALPEAGLGVAPVVPVQHIQIPQDPQTGCPSWALRRYPKQDVAGWVRAIEAVLGDAIQYGRLSTQSRSKAMEYVQQGEQELQHFLSRCQQLG